MPTHESFPAFASIRIDRVGDLWGAAEDEVGVERVRWYALSRSSG